MFRTVRKKKNEIGIEAVKSLLKKERRGVLAVHGDEGYPYAIPINYLYCEEEGKIYFHGSGAGHKVDSIKKNDKVCFTVYGNETVGEEDWAPYLHSAVVFGRCKMTEDRDRTIELVRRFAKKYYPDETLLEEEIDRSGKAVRMFEIDIEHMSGKEIQER